MHQDYIFKSLFRYFYWIL